MGFLIGLIASFGRQIKVLPAANFGKLVDIRNGGVTAIACSDGKTARGLLAALRRNGLARRAGNGLAAGVGVSVDTNEIGRLPAALDEALAALEFAGAARPLVHFSDIDLPEFLIRRADNTALRLIPEWARHFGARDDDQSRALTRKIRTFADCNFNVKRTAQGLGVHTNTVYFRLNRIKKLTGVYARTYSGTSLLLTRAAIAGDSRPRHAEPGLTPVAAIWELAGWARFALFLLRPHPREEIGFPYEIVVALYQSKR
jgi:hypothetical protein